MRHFAWTLDGSNNAITIVELSSNGENTVIHTVNSADYTQQSDIYVIDWITENIGGTFGIWDSEEQCWDEY